MRRATVFVLDVSASMSDIKCEILHMLVSKFMLGFSWDNLLNIYVGIVLFNDTAWTVYNVDYITSRKQRNDLDQCVPIMAYGDCDVGGALLHAQDALKQANIATNSAQIILVTGGQNNVGDNNYAKRVLKQLINSKVLVTCVGIGLDNCEQLDYLATATGGHTYYIPAIDTEALKAVPQVFEAILHDMLRTVTTGQLTCVSSYIQPYTVITVMEKAIMVDNNQPTRVIPVAIDPDIAPYPLRFRVSGHHINSLSVQIQSPSGITYNTNNLNLDASEHGEWNIRLIKHDNKCDKINARIVVESDANTTGAIELNVGTIVPDSGDCPPIIVARLHRSGVPIIGARLTASVGPVMDNKIELQLDKYHPNGYYYNYFTQYSQPGYYAFNVVATGDGVIVKYKDSFVEPFCRYKKGQNFYIKHVVIAVPENDELFEQLLQNNDLAHLYYTHLDARVPQWMIYDHLCKWRGGLSPVPDNRYTVLKIKGNKNN